MGKHVSKGTQLKQKALKSGIAYLENLERPEGSDKSIKGDEQRLYLQDAWDSLQRLRKHPLKSFEIAAQILIIRETPLFESYQDHPSDISELEDIIEGNKGGLKAAAIRERKLRHS